MKIGKPLYRSTTIVTLLLTVIQVGATRGEDKPKAPDFDRWESEIKAIEKRLADKPPPENPILFVGSSTIRRWDLAKSFPDLGAVNVGFGGSQTADATHFAPRIVLRYKPRLIVFYSGDNDLASGKTPETVAADFKEFVAVVHKDLPKIKIVLVSVKPTPLRWKLFDAQKKTNALLEAYCKTDDTLGFVDVVKPMLGEDGKPKKDLFVEDRLHLSDEGYKVWTGILKPLLK
jgi:lysophospholipase L1-like esterase